MATEKLPNLIYSDQTQNYHSLGFDSGAPTADMNAHLLVELSQRQSYNDFNDIGMCHHLW